MFNQQPQMTGKTETVEKGTSLTLAEVEKQLDETVEAIERVRDAIKGRMSVQQDADIRSLLAKLDELSAQAKHLESGASNEGTL